jgi:GNAT superfamily N-acetyltransferase
MIFREITIRDILALFNIRTAVRENAYTREGLYSEGITEPAVENMLRTSHRGWLCECDAKVVGFAMANRETAEFWVIAVLPEYEGRGVGSKLLNLAENWLWEIGWKEIWLWTSLDTRLRAYSFYRKHGWVDAEVRTNQRIMKKSKLPLSQGEQAIGQVESWTEKYRCGKPNG